MSETTDAPRTEFTHELELARQLIEWYWTEGVMRGERPANSPDWTGSFDQFKLPTGTWLRHLYAVRDGLDTVQAARRNSRPAVALWGLSQTGKSTSVSALVDTNVKVSAEHPETDGSGGGLHWEGGRPFFFVAPHRDTDKGEEYPPHWYERSLNPFNSGLDASSCVTRFVAGSLTPRDGCVTVVDPLHPVQVHLVPPADLLYALARGFDSECLGQGTKGRPKDWTPERLDQSIAVFSEPYLGKSVGPPKREAYERMLSVVSTLDELVFARVETFAKLRTSDADWQCRLESLLGDDLLVSDPKIADDFAALLFWNSSDIFTWRYQTMRSLYATLMAAWGGKPVYASLQVASLLLDMQSCVNAYRSGKDPASREGKQSALIKTLGFHDAGAHVLVGCGESYPHLLGAKPEQFSNFQGLVWELVVPINLDQLAPGPFRDLLAGSDLLDFPGVGRDEKNETNRLNAHPAVFPSARPEQVCTAERFFSDVVKRGKTASIVATYSRRLNVDSFCILQNLDKDEPSNHATEQLATGIRTWLRNMAPGFTEGAGTPPPGVSLNLGLTFWGEFVDQSKPDRSANFELRRKFYGKLGVIADPAVATIFALNYHWMKGPRVKFTQLFRKGAPLYERVLAEPEFQRMFHDPRSLRSLEEMTDDLERQGSGGSDYLFEQLRLQVVSRTAEERAARFLPLTQRLTQAFSSLLAWRHFRRPHVERDTRVEELEAFASRLADAIKGRDEEAVRSASYALRELLNVEPETLTLPPNGRPGLTGAYIEKLYNEWKTRQVGRYDAWARGGGAGDLDWARLGFRNRDDLARGLDALITSLGRTCFLEISKLAVRVWDLMPAQERAEHRQHHRRRYLALEMTNRLLYKAPGGRSAPRPRPPARAPANTEPAGAATPAYAAFIGPFVDTQLAAIKQHLTPVVLRPALNGDLALDKIVGTS